MELKTDDMNGEKMAAVAAFMAAVDNVDVMFKSKPEAQVELMKMLANMLPSSLPEHV